MFVGNASIVHGDGLHSMVGKILKATDGRILVRLI